MALIFTTGTINQANAGAVGQAMVEKIRDDVVAHPAWELVEEFTPGGGAVRWYVLKCLGAANGHGTDFFVVLGRTLGSGEIRGCICEEYDSATHTMKYYPPGFVSSGPTFDASGRLPTTISYVLGTVVLPSGGNTPHHHYWTPSGTSTKWWIIVDDDRVTAAFNGAANGFFSFGGYTPLDQLGNSLPLMMIGSSNSEGRVIRNPALAGVVGVSYTNSLSVNGGGGTSLAQSVGLGFEGPWQYNDKLQNNMRAVAEVGVTMITQPANQDWPSYYGYILGKQKGMRRSEWTMPIGFAFGDAFSLNGTLWVPWKPDLGFVFDTGVASA